MGPDVHFRRTFLWAEEEGFSAEDAEALARADVGYDLRFPAKRTPVNITRHFAPTAWLWSRHYLRRALHARDLALLGWALHCAQDAVAHGTLAEKHLLFRAHLGRDPDDWDLAPEGVRRRIENVTRSRLREYLARA